MTSIAVNGRFLSQPLTGVQRVALELLTHLPVGERRTALLSPPRTVRDLTERVSIESHRDDRWSGLRGHLWEQTTLRRLFRQSGADVLLGPGGWGPLGLRRQVPIIYDLHPLLFPEYFVPSFVRMARIAMPVLARRSVAVVVLSQTVRRHVIERLGASASRVHVIPAGVGAPFIDRALDDLDGRAGRYCLFVGGDKLQKNLAFVLAFWEAVHDELGIELVVTERAVGSRVLAPTSDPPGVRRVVDPSDVELCELMAGALCILSPSSAEGYNLPLLEAMAVGTPFLATDTGAARELAVDAEEQVLPLEAHRWIDAIRRWTQDADRLLARRHEGVAAARKLTWDAAAAELRAVVEAAAPSRSRP